MEDTFFLSATRIAGAYEFANTRVHAADRYRRGFLWSIAGDLCGRSRIQHDFRVIYF
jgi:hypothetical protein